jgi:hypothetical protein
MIKFIKNLQFIFQPSFWITQYPYCPFLDKKINDFLDQGIKFTNINEYNADLGNLTSIWIGNYPYAFGYLYWYGKSMPSRLTVKRMKRVLAECVLEMKKNKLN